MSKGHEEREFTVVGFHLNFEWTKEDTEKVLKMAKANTDLEAIAKSVGRKEIEVLILIEELRKKTRIGSVMYGYVVAS